MAIVFALYAQVSFASIWMDGWMMGMVLCWVD